jgi:cytochrome P450
VNAPSSASDLFTSPKRFADLDGWHHEADVLRAASPIHLIDRSEDDFRPFHAVLSHAAVMEVERQPELFTNHPDTVLARTKDLERQRAAGASVRTLVHMDAPDHPKYRKLTADWFKPGSLGRLQSRLDQLSAQTIDRMVALGGSCEFASEVAVWYPLQVILAILGLPENDYGRMLELTQEFFGSGTSSKGKRGMDEVIAAVQDMFAYFLDTTMDRRANPTDDLATVIANGLIDGSQIPDRETISYYIIVATAGHDTTSSSISGGLQALIENPSQVGAAQGTTCPLELCRRRDDPLRLPRSSFHAHGPSRHHPCRVTCTQKAIGFTSRTSLPIVILPYSKAHSASTSPAPTPTSTLPSDSAPTTASVHNWPVWNCAPSSATSSPASNISNWPSHQRQRPQPSSAAPRP